MTVKPEVAAEAKLELFCREYIVDFNASEAALRAGLTTSKRAARQRGYEMMQREDVHKLIAQLAASKMEAVECTADDVIAGLLTEARYHGQGASHAARVAAWVHLGKYHNIFGERDGGVSDDAYDRIAAARARADARASGKLADLSERRKRA